MDRGFQEQSQLLQVAGKGLRMDLDNTTVTMSLKDFNDLRAYKNSYERLRREIKNLTYIDQMTAEETTVIIKKSEAQDFIAPFAATDCELEDYPDGVKVIWK